MKKVIISIVVLLTAAFNCYAANELRVSTVSIPQGEKGVINIELENDQSFVAFNFVLTLPEGITYDSFEKGSRYTEGLSPSCNANGQEISSAYLDMNAMEPITGNSGTLLKIYVKADVSVTGKSLEATISNIVFTTEDLDELNLSDVTFKINVEGGEGSIVTLDETSATAPEAQENVTANVTRTFKASQWSTICLPFAMTDAQMKEAFGDSYQLADFSGCTAEKDGETVTSIKVSFSSVTTGLAANHPYIIKTSKDVSTFSVSNVSINPNGELETVSGSSKMKGNYVSGTTISENGLFLNDGQFWYSNGSTKMKAFRACFYFSDVLTDKSKAATRAIINVNGDNTTGVDALQLYPNISGKVYSLSGQEMGDQIESLPKGVYIKDGKKVVKK